MSGDRFHDLKSIKINLFHLTEYIDINLNTITLQNNWLKILFETDCI